MDTLLFPRCGITMQHVLTIAGVADNKRDAAKKLGVSERQFYTVISRHNLGHLFANRKPRKVCVTKEDIVALAQERYTRKDAAYILGISPEYLKKLIQRWNLADMFVVSKGKASWVTRRGYTS